MQPRRGKNILRRALPELGEVGAGLGEIGLQSQRGFVLGDGAGYLTGALQCAGEMVMGDCPLG